MRWKGWMRLMVGVGVAIALGAGSMGSSWAAAPGINIGAYKDRVDDVIKVVGNGGWVVFMATPGDCNVIESAGNKSINVIVRGHYPGQSFEGANAQKWAKSWAYTLANMKTANVIYFMPLNEPNQENSSDYQSPQAVVNYIQALEAELNNLGIRGSKVKLLSPMFNATHPNIANYINQVKRLDPNFFNRFDGIAMNLYDFENQPGKVFEAPTKEIPMKNAKDFGFIVDNLYGASGKPVYGVEAGVVRIGEGVVYRDEYLMPFVQRAQNELGSVMFAVFSYDPEHEENWDIFNSGTRNVFRPINGGPQPVTEISEQTANDINILIQKGELVRCNNSCGLAVSEEFCTTYGPPAGGVLKSGQISAGGILQGFSQVIKIKQNYKLPDNSNAKIKVTRNVALVGFDGIQLPFVKNLATYLGGDLIFNSGIRQPSVLTRLLTAEEQDRLRYQYQQNCLKGVFCNGKNNLTNPRCGKDETINECVIITRATGERIAIEEIPTKPLPDNYQDPIAYQNALKDWQKDPKYLFWYDIPAFDNPQVVSDGAINVQACPAGEKSQSDTGIKVPWLSALSQVSKMLSNILANNQALPNRQSQSKGVRVASSNKADGLQVGWKTNQENLLALDVRGGYEDPVFKGCNQAPIKSNVKVYKNPVMEASGVKVKSWGLGYIQGPTVELKCEKWRPRREPGDPQVYYDCIDKKGRVSYSVDDPLWVTVTLPYLDQVINDLAGKERGAFNFLLSSYDPKETETILDQHAEGTINYKAAVFEERAFLKQEFEKQVPGISEAELIKKLPPDKLGDKTLIGEIDGEILGEVKPETQIVKEKTAGGDEEKGRFEVRGLSLFIPKWGGLMDLIDRLQQCVLYNNIGYQRCNFKILD